MTAPLNGEVTADASRLVWARARNRMAEDLLPAAPDDDLGRLNVHLAGDDLATWKALWESGFYDAPAVVTDQATGVVVRLWRASCGSGCYCAAEVGVWESDQPVRTGGRR